MGKDPAVLFYTADFITGTITMTDEQRGKYILLLCLQHQKYYLTKKDMLNICKTYDKDIWDKFAQDDGRFYNERMRFEAEKRKNYSLSRSQNRTAKPKEKKKICKTYDKHMENENENINEYINTINNLLEKKFKLTDKLRPKVKNILKEYTLQEIETAVGNAKQDKFHIENDFKYLTAEFFTRSDKVDRFLNITSNGEHIIPIYKKLKDL